MAVALAVALTLAVPLTLAVALALAVAVALTVSLAVALAIALTLTISLTLTVALALTVAVSVARTRCARTGVGTRVVRGRRPVATVRAGSGCRRITRRPVPIRCSRRVRRCVTRRRLLIRTCRWCRRIRARTRTVPGGRTRCRCRRRATAVRDAGVRVDYRRRRSIERRIARARCSAQLTVGRADEVRRIAERNVSTGIAGRARVPRGRPAAACKCDAVRTRTRCVDVVAQGRTERRGEMIDDVRGQSERADGRRGYEERGDQDDRKGVRPAEEPGNRFRLFPSLLPLLVEARHEERVELVLERRDPALDGLQLSPDGDDERAPVLA